MVVVKSPSRIAEDRRRYGKRPMSAAEYKRNEKRYRVYLAAKRVWRQISDNERVWILGELGYDDPKAANARDENHDMRELRINDGSDLIFIRDYPQSDHRQQIYKQKLAAGNKRQDVLVRKHEKRLRSARFAKHEKRSQMRRRPSW